MGAITPLKGHDIFLDAAERVLSQLPNAVFVIAGNNSYRTERGLGYEEGLRRSMPPALAGRVKFVGFRNDVPNILSQLDVLVQPNRGPEGLGRSVLEAMACGVPVIAVDKWGPAELVQHGETGLLFPPLDAKLLAAHMLTLGKDESLRKFMGKLGHDWIQKNLVPRKLAGQFDQSPVRRNCFPASGGGGMKVLQLGKFYHPVVGGIETALKEICEGLSDQVDFQILVANTRWSTEHENGKLRVTRAASLGKCLSCPIAPSFPVWAKKFDADLIHVHLANPLAELSALLADRDVPIVAHFHSDVVRPLPPVFRTLYNQFLHAFYRRVNCIVVPTPQHIEVSKFVPRYREKCRVVPFGIPVARFNLDEAGRKRVDELRDGPPTVLFVGRLVYYKGVEFLIRAMADTKARLRIVGTGPLEDSLRALARQKGIADRVEFLGQVSERDLHCSLPCLRCFRPAIHN